MELPVRGRLPFTLPAAPARGGTRPYHLASQRETVGRRLSWIVVHERSAYAVHKLKRLVTPGLWADVINDAWRVYGERGERPAMVVLERIFDSQKHRMDAMHMAEALVTSGAQVELLTPLAQVYIVNMVYDTLSFAKFSHMVKRVCPAARHAILADIIIERQRPRGIDTEQLPQRFDACLRLHGDADIMYNVCLPSWYGVQHMGLARCSLLGLAWCCEDIDMMRKLFQAGASPNGVGCGDALYHFQATVGSLTLDPACLWMLLQHGLDVRTARRMLTDTAEGAFKDKCAAYIHSHACMPLQHLAAVALRQRWSYVTVRDSGLLSDGLLGIVAQTTGKHA